MSSGGVGPPKEDKTKHIKEPNITKPPPISKSRNFHRNRFSLDSPTSLCADPTRLCRTGGDVGVPRP